MTAAVRARRRFHGSTGVLLVVCALLVPASPAWGVADSIGRARPHESAHVEHADPYDDHWWVDEYGYGEEYGYEGEYGYEEEYDEPYFYEEPYGEEYAYEDSGDSGDSGEYDDPQAAPVPPAPSEPEPEAVLPSASPSRQPQPARSEPVTPEDGPAETWGAALEPAPSPSGSRRADMANAPLLDPAELLPLGTGLALIGLGAALLGFRLRRF